MLFPVERQAPPAAANGAEENDVQEPGNSTARWRPGWILVYTHCTVSLIRTDQTGAWFRSRFPRVQGRYPNLLMEGGFHATQQS